MARAKSDRKPDFDYAALGITREHVPDLLRMLTDARLNMAPGESLEVWAPLHAWRVLGGLKAEEAVEPLLSLLQYLDDDMDDWMSEEVPEVLAAIGPACVPAIAAFLADTTHGTWSKAAAVRALGTLAANEAGARAACVEVLVRTLENFPAHDPILNSILVDQLVELKALEALPLIREAFRLQQVDTSMRGDYQDIEVDLGIRSARSLPALPFHRGDDRHGPSHPAGGDQLVRGRAQRLVPVRERPEVQEVLHQPATTHRRPVTYALTPARRLPSW